MSRRAHGRGGRPRGPPRGARLRGGSRKTGRARWDEVAGAPNGALYADPKHGLVAQRSRRPWKTVTCTSPPAARRTSPPPWSAPSPASTWATVGHAGASRAGVRATGRQHAQAQGDQRERAEERPERRAPARASRRRGRLAAVPHLPPVSRARRRARGPEGKPLCGGRSRPVDQHGAVAGEVDGLPVQEDDGGGLRAAGGPDPAGAGAGRGAAVHAPARLQ